MYNYKHFRILSNHYGAFSPDIVRLTSLGPTADLYVDRLGDYKLLQDTFQAGGFISIHLNASQSISILLLQRILVSQPARPTNLLVFFHEKKFSCVMKNSIFFDR